MPDEHHVLLKEDVRNLPDTRYLLSLMPLLGCLVLMTIMLAGCDGKTTHFFTSASGQVRDCRSA